MSAKWSSLSSSCGRPRRTSIGRRDRMAAAKGTCSVVQKPADDPDLQLTHQRKSGRCGGRCTPNRATRAPRRSVLSSGCGRHRPSASGRRDRRTAAQGTHSVLQKPADDSDLQVAQQRKPGRRGGGRTPSRATRVLLRSSLSNGRGPSWRRAIGPRDEGAAVQSALMEPTCTVVQKPADDPDLQVAHHPEVPTLDRRKADPCNTRTSPPPGAHGNRM
jgi:hypothetical protein